MNYKIITSTFLCLAIIGSFGIYKVFANQNKEVNMDNKKVLVAYYSHSGNTKAVAEKIQNLTGGDIFEITPKTDFQTFEEIELTKKLCQKYNIKQLIIEADVLENPLINNNPKNRCYECKKFLFKTAAQKAFEHGKKYLIDGTNFDDLNTHRPGIKALEELEIISPFAKFGITKKEIGEYAKECGIEIYDKPSTPCLATRFPYNTKLTKQNLQMAEQGEVILKKYGYKNCRFRIHGNIARIEIPPEQFDSFIKEKTGLIKDIKALNIKYVTLDLEGMRSGSMDI